MSRSFESDANNYNMVRGMNNDSSDSSSGDTIPSFTHLGRKVVPITSTCQELLNAIEKFRWDCPFTTEIIRQSTVYFPDNQLVLIQEVLDATDLIKQFGYEQRFVDELKNFEDELDLRIDAEKTFFDQQKKRHVKIYEILRQSSFPYSASQTACFNRMIGALYQLTGDPSSEADKVFEVSLRALVRLLQLDDHLRDPAPHRVVVFNTIHFYLQGMVSKLKLLAAEERGRPHPDFIRPDSKVDLAIYLVEDLGALVDVTKILTQREHFHYGMVEIYTRFVEIFRKSGLDVSNIQDVVLQKIERRVRDLRKSPLMGKHNGIIEACLEFMSELEEDNPDREYELEGDKLVLAPEGENNKAIKEISWDLIYLQPIATEHLANFSSFGNGVENVVAQLMERFLDLYPMH